MPAQSGDGDPLLRPDRHSLVHTGRLSLSGISLERLLEGIRLAIAEEELRRRLDLVFAGSVTEHERRLLEAPDLAGSVRFVGWLERPRALALQRAADTLLVVTEGAARQSVATGKLYEYLAARRPILVLGAETEAARIVADAGAGVSASASNPRAVAEALRRLVVEPPPPPPPDAAERYAYPRLVEQLGAVIEQAVAQEP